MTTENAAQQKKLPQAEPAAGVAAYHRERELALEFSPRRKENYQRYTQSVRRKAKVDYLPTVIDIENVSRCNFRCVMCDVSTLPKGKRAADMSFDYFKQLVDEQYGLVEIKLHGAGEPLLQGDEFFKMIEYARAQHIWVRTVTNGSALHNGNYKKLVDSGINEIQISIDGADKQTFEAIRRGSNFERVVENVKLINSYCKEVGKSVTKMWTMVQTGNVDQLERLVEFAVELGFSNQVFSLQMHGFGSDALAIENRARSVDHLLSFSRLSDLVERGIAVGSKVAFWSVAEKYDWRDPTKLCPWPFERAYISSDTRTVPCCMIANPDRFEIGKGKGFTQVWDGEEFAKFREDHLTGNLPKVCKACYKNNGD